MSTFDDSSFEMHDDSLTPETADRLLDGEISSPEFADLAAMVNDVRSMASATPTPAVRGALAEYVGVGLTATEPPADLPVTAAVSENLDLTTADQPRRKSVIAEVVTFAGTLSGKLLLGGAVAAASISGAQATGIVDLPGLPDKGDTVAVADEPVDEVPAELPLEDKVEESEDDEPKPVEDEQDKSDEADDEEKAEEPKEEEKESDEKDAEDKAEDKVEEEPKVEEPKTEQPKEDKPKEDKPKEEPASNEEAIEALLTQLLLDKEAVYANATALIEPLKAEKKPLVEALNATLATLETARNEAKAPLYAELETTEDEARKVEIEAELSAIFEQWEVDRDAAIAAASPAINAIKVQIENIEIERDAEITRLLEEYEAAVDALEK